ncbi:MAG: hypothetical protein ACYC2Y_06530 [Armatimonadota bacterium]
MKRTRRFVAPYEMIQRDFRELDAAEKLRTTWDTERLILIQSVQGHAHEGHATFRGRRFPNTSIDDIARALRLDPTWMRTERQHLIDEVVHYAERAIAGEENLTLSNGDGIGLLSSSMFNQLDVPPHSVLRGLYLGGLRDDPSYRFDMEARYGITIGGGRCYLVNTRVMEEMGLNGEILAHGAHEEMIDYYRETGLIIADSGADGEDADYLYIRHRRGQGASDDTGIVAAGLLWDLGTAIGVFLADAVDTLEKYVPVFSDQDGNLGKKVGETYSKLDVSDADVRHLAYLSAIPDENDFPVPDSSLRYLMLVDRRHDLTAVESHLLCVQGKRYAPIRIGHEEVSNREFYEYVQARVASSPGAL